jgi:hypothetical protein
MGWIAYEQSEAMHDFLAQMIDFSESFEVGLLALVGGLASPPIPALRKSKSGAVRPIR